MPRSVPAVVVAALLLAVPASASATTTVTRSGTAITITGDDGPNAVSVDGTGNFIMYKDPTGSSIVAGEGCAQDSPSVIYCGEGGPGLTATVILGAGDDTYDDRVARTDWPVADADAGDGNDTVNGSYGNDLLRGGAGDDTLRGIAGDDQIDGGPGTDTIHGGADNDTIFGGAGSDLIYGDGDYSGTTIGGNDTIKARDGEVDQIACGWAADIAEVDADDVEDVDCETVDRPGAGPDPGSGSLQVALGKPKAVGLRALAKGKALVVPATFSGPCTGLLKLTVGAAEARRAKLGRSKVVLAALAGDAPAGAVRLSLRVKKAYRAKIRPLKRLKTTLSIVCADDAGSVDSQVMALTLTR